MTLGAVSIKRSINAPFARSNANNETAANGAEAANLNKDTDSDGLKDGDELNTYGTSPYLADSDSDGIDDGKEIAEGTDPNCPKSKICTGTQLGSAPPANNGGEQSPFASALTGAPTVAELRDLLKNSGMSPEQVDKLTDEQILQAYNQALSEQQAGAASGSASGSATTLSASEVRSLLLNAGVPKEKLDSVSDEDLLKLYEETMAELQQQKP